VSALGCIAIHSVSIRIYCG